MQQEIRRNMAKEMVNLAFKISIGYTSKCFFTCRKILQRVADGFTSPLKEGTLWICVALKIHHIIRV
jgi:hypothetical protein